MISDFGSCSRGRDKSTAVDSCSCSCNITTTPYHSDRTYTPKRFGQQPCKRDLMEIGCCPLVQQHSTACYHTGVRPRSA
eukprot:2178547-Amphidinium_carterae.1